MSHRHEHMRPSTVLRKAYRVAKRVVIALVLLYAAARAVHYEYVKQECVRFGHALTTYRFQSYCFRTINGSEHMWKLEYLQSLPPLTSGSSL